MKRHLRFSFVISATRILVAFVAEIPLEAGDPSRSRPPRPRTPWSPYLAPYGQYYGALTSTGISSWHTLRYSPRTRSCALRLPSWLHVTITPHLHTGSCRHLLRLPILRLSTVGDPRPPPLLLPGMHIDAASVQLHPLRQSHQHPLQALQVSLQHQPHQPHQHPGADISHAAALLPPSLLCEQPVTATTSRSPAACTGPSSALCNSSSATVAATVPAGATGDPNAIIRVMIARAIPPINHCRLEAACYSSGQQSHWMDGHDDIDNDWCLPASSRTRSHRAR